MSNQSMFKCRTKKKRACAYAVTQTLQKTLKLFLTPLYTSNSNNSVTYLRTFCTSIPATTPMVVGRLAAQTPSRFNVFSSIFAATTSGGAHWGAIEKLNCKKAFKKSHGLDRILRYYCMSCARMTLTRPADLHTPSPTLKGKWAIQQSSTYRKTSGFTRYDQLDVSWHCIFTHSRLHPDLSKFIAGLTNTETCRSALQKFNKKKRNQNNVINWEWWNTFISLLSGKKAMVRIRDMKRQKLFLKGQIKQRIKVALMKPALCAFLRSWDALTNTDISDPITAHYRI